MEIFMSNFATKDDLNTLNQSLSTRIEGAIDSLTKTMNARFDGMTASFHEEIREVLSYFKTSQAKQDERFDRVDVKLDAIMETAATRTELKSLIREISHHGMNVDESKVLFT
jgi:hypothetical protein